MMVLFSSGTHSEWIARALGLFTRRRAGGSLLEPLDHAHRRRWHDDGAESHGSPTVRTRNSILLENPPHQRGPGQPRWLGPQRWLIGEPDAEVLRRSVHWLRGYDLAAPGVVGCEDAVLLHSA